MAVADVAKIRISLDANTAEFQAKMDLANARMKAFGVQAGEATSKLKEGSHAAVTGVQATSASLRVLEGNMQNNLRAAENFLAKTLGLGETLKAAFPVVGAIALAGVMSELVKRASDVYEAFKRMQEAPGRIAEEFQAITQPIRIANDELAVANDKLENEIAKLQGRRQNNLKLALDEARLSADKLAESIERDLKEVEQLLEKESVGGLKGFFTGNAATTGLTEQVKKFRDQMAAISLETAERIANKTDAKQQATIYEDATKQRIAALDGEIKKTRDALAATEALQAARTKAVQAPAVSPYGVVPFSSVQQPIGGPDQSILLAQQRNLLSNLLQERNNASLRIQNEGLTAQKSGLDATKEKPLDPVADKLRELQARLQEVKVAAAAPVGDTLAAALAKGFGEAERSISATSKALEEHSQKMTLGQRAEILGLSDQIALTEMATKAKEKQDAVQTSIEEGAAKIAQDMQLQADAENAKLQKLNDENNALREQIKYAAMGPEAAWQAKYAETARNAKTPEDQARVTEEGLKHQAQIAETVAKINEQTEATRRLTAATNEGLAAERAAAIANLEASGKDTATIQAEIAAQKEKWELEDAQTMRTATASQGVSRYFHEMVDNARSAGAEMHDLLSSAFSGINDNLAKLISGQKASWASLFLGMAEQVAKSGLQNLEAKIAGGLFGQKSEGAWSEKIPGSGLLGGLVGGAAGRRDGSSESTAFYVQMVGVPGGSSLSGVGLINPGGGDATDDGGGFFGFVKGLFGGFRAEGGAVDPGHAYMVGERGPELWTPASKGTIVPNHRLGGSVAFYSIDARGANEADVQMRVERALTAVHGSAIRNSVAMQQEARLRRPRSKG